MSQRFKPGIELAGRRAAFETEYQTAMPRGSKPGERRGGRRRATPNKRTVLRDRILSVASANPTATCYELLHLLIKDQALPAPTRLAIARKSSSQSMLLTDNAPPDAKTEAKTLAPLDILLSVAQDAAATAAERRKAASEAAEYFLPKNPAGRKTRQEKFAPDKYGFVVDPKLARELRDSKLKLACLPLAKRLTPYAVAQRAAKLQMRITAIQRSLQCPCPARYGFDEFKLDGERLDSFSRRRVSKKILTLDEDIEEALRMARCDSLLEGPEVAARVRLADLRAKKRIADNQGPPLTPAQAAAFRFLALLYPSDPPKKDKRTKAEHAVGDLPVSDGGQALDNHNDSDLVGNAAARDAAVAFAREIKHARPELNWNDWFVPIVDAHGHKIGEVAVTDV